MPRPLPLALVLSACAPVPGAPLASADPDANLRGEACPSSIQDAIDKAADGAVVAVCTGTYTERITIAGRRIVLRASGPDVTLDAQGLGTALSVTGRASVLLDGLTITGGSTSGTGGDVYCSGSNLTIRNSRLTGGAASQGGGLGAIDCVGIVTTTTFDTNTAATGGGAYVEGNGLRLLGNTVLANEAALAGGGVYLEGSAELSGNLVEANTTLGSGGGGYVQGSVGWIAGNTIRGNTSGDDGGGLYVSDGAPTVEANTFEDNDADDEGGGLRVKLAEATILDNAFVSNHADYRGGGAKISHDEVVISGNTWSGNTAWVAGGAVLLEESASLLTFETYGANEARYGGAVANVTGWDDVVIEDSAFVGNRAWSDGGHLYVDLPLERTVLRRVDLDAGEADRGGAIFAVDSEVVLENTLLRGNVASVAGGGLYLDATSGEVTNCVAWQNDAPTGAVLEVVNGVAPFDVVNDVFYQNLGGAAVRAVSGVAPTIRYGDFSGNAANVSGMPNPIGSNGNLAVAPGFTSPAAGDFTLTPTSPLVDAGDPVVADRDGTRSDMGLYGGPEGPEL